MITSFFGVKIKNGAHFSDATEKAFELLFEKFEGVKIDVPDSTTTLFYYKDPRFGQHVLAYYINEGNLYQVGVTKPYDIVPDASSFEGIHAAAIEAVKGTLVTEEEPKVQEPEVKPSEDEADVPPTEEPKTEEPKEEPKEETPAEPENEALVDALDGEEVFTQNGRYWVNRNGRKVYVFKVPNALDVETGSMVLEDAPAGTDLLADEEGRLFYYYGNKKIYVKKPSNETEAPSKPEEKPAEPKEESPADTPDVPNTPEAPVEEPKPEEPKTEEPKEEPKAEEPGLLLNGVKVADANNDEIIQFAGLLKDKKFELSEDGKYRIYELLRALSMGEITVEIFFHELETGVLTREVVNKNEASLDFVSFREEIEKVIEKFLNKKDEATPSESAE